MLIRNRHNRCFHLLTALLSSKAGGLENLELDKEQTLDKLAGVTYSSFCTAHSLNLALSLRNFMFR